MQSKILYKYKQARNRKDGLQLSKKINDIHSFKLIEYIDTIQIQIR